MSDSCCETGISHVYGGQAYVSSSETTIINRILKLKEENPDDVHIIRMPEDNDGCIYVRMPFSFVKLAGPRHLNLTDEERALRAQRLRNVRIDKKPQYLT